MQRFLLSFLLTGLLLLCFSQNKQGKELAALVKAFNAANIIFLQAERESLQAGDNELLQSKADQTYKQALNAFTLLLPAVEKTGHDSLAFFLRLKTGFIHNYFDSADAARNDYLAAFALKEKMPSIADSFLFIPSLFTGGIYYSYNQFDSAIYYYKKAEQLNVRYKIPLYESQRLYNRLGGIYYETGDYRQARNYFEKVVSLTNPADKLVIANYKINVASLLVKLEEFESAQIIYESLLPSTSFNNEIYHSLGIIKQKQQDPKQSIGYLRKVNYSGNKKSIDLNYHFAVAYSQLNENDSAGFYIQTAIAENVKWNSRRKNIQYGLILKFQAEEHEKNRSFKEAAGLYQQAIIQFLHDYKETDSYKNPEHFGGIVSFINLFNTLIAKANTFENWYQHEKDIEMLKASLQAYQAAFKLAEYVGKTYDSDEARLFLGKIKYQVHSKPINVSLLLYDLTKKRHYLEEAYLFDQRNKASLFTFIVREKEPRIGSGENEWVRKELLLKKTITRLSLKAAQSTDTILLQHISAAIRDYEIELGKLQEKLNVDPVWRRKRSGEQIPTVNQLQKKLDNNTALLSYHLSGTELLVFLITPSRFEYHRSPVNENFFVAIESLKNSLHTTDSSQRYNGTTVSTRLYEKLIAPVESQLSQVKRLIIIPDDELSYLPFEALQNENKKYLVEQFSIQYQYSSASVGRQGERKHKTGILSFAPFASEVYRDSSGYTLSALPASKEEIVNLQGIALTDKDATKENFLLLANRYATIHLATHASINDLEPSSSFIAFYPAIGEYKLYTREIADLPLDSTKLVILSACETSAGHQVKGEGLMSFSRAFAYAGCPNIITSLWKTDDKTSAFLTRQLHYYLDKNYTKDKALQQAKLDLLSSTEIDPRLKSPNYWAHLLFIGDYEPSHHTSNWWWIAIAFIVGAVLYKLAGKKTG